MVYRCWHHTESVLLPLGITLEINVKRYLETTHIFAGGNWGQEEKGATEDEVVEWHQWLNGHGLSKFQEMVKDRDACCAAVHGAQRVRDDRLTGQQRVLSSAAWHLPREIFDLAIKRHVRQIFIKHQRVGVSESRAAWSLPHLLRPPLQVDAAHRQRENRCDCVPTKHSNNCPNKRHRPPVEAWGH